MEELFEELHKMFKEHNVVKAKEFKWTTISNDSVRTSIKLKLVRTNFELKSEWNTYKICLN